jgi:mannose PTS system EIIA component
MIGIVIVTHGNLGSELIRAASMIKGDIDNVIPVSIDATKNVEDLKKNIAAAIKKAEKGRGILILTDLFGGTPSNLSLSFLKEGKVEVLTGVNLPMLLKVSELQKKEGSLSEFAGIVRDYGKKNIYLAGEILERKVNT